VGWEKVACWSTKAAISLKRVKIEEKLLYGGPIGTHQSYELQILYAHSLRSLFHWNKSPLKISGKVAVGVLRAPIHKAHQRHHAVIFAVASCFRLVIKYQECISINTVICYVRRVSVSIIILSAMYDVAQVI